MYEYRIIVRLFCTSWWAFCWSRKSPADSSDREGLDLARSWPRRHSRTRARAEQCSSGRSRRRSANSSSSRCRPPRETRRTWCRAKSTRLCCGSLLCSPRESMFGRRGFSRSIGSSSLFRRVFLIWFLCTPSGLIDMLCEIPSHRDFYDINNSVFATLCVIITLRKVLLVFWVEDIGCFCEVLFE